MNIIMPINVYYAAPEPFSGTVDHQALLNHIARYPVTVLRAHSSLESANAVIAEVTETSPRQIERVDYVAKELGRPALFLAIRARARPLDERLRGLSKIRPDGVLYSAPFVARSAVSVFMMAHLGLELPGALDSLNQE